MADLTRQPLRTFGGAPGRAGCANGIGRRWLKTFKQLLEFERSATLTQTVGPDTAVLEFQFHYSNRFEIFIPLG